MATKTVQENVSAKQAGSQPVKLRARHKKKNKSANNSSTMGIRLGRKSIDKTRACRYELKYRIGESQAAAVERFIKPYIHLDHYSRIQPNNYYPIVSQYLDSNDLKLCRETLAGKKNRFKLRIRSYSNDIRTARFIEIKRRINNIIMKSRLRVTHKDAMDLLNGRPFTKKISSVDEKTLRQFPLSMSCLNARPVVRVQYMRKAYEGDSDNRVRVTFDRRLCYNIGSEPNLTLNGTGWQHTNVDNVILEIKFTARYPAWLGEMVKCCNLRQQSMSKYASAIKQSCQKGFCAPQISL